MKRAIILGILSVFFLISCGTKNPSELISEADSMFVNLSVAKDLGIEDYDDFKTKVIDDQATAKDYFDEILRKRERIEQLYDQALRKLESGDYNSDYTLDEIRKMKAKANFSIAFLRTVDFIEKLAGLLSTGSSGETTATTINLESYNALIKRIFETSLFPIIDNYDAALSLGDFSYKLENFWIDFSAFFGADAGRVVFDMSGKEVDNTDAYMINAVLKLLGGGTEILLAYNKLLNVILTYGKYFSGPYDKTKIFNMVPGAKNPLLDPEFGVFSETGLDSLNKAQNLFAGSFADIRDGFSYLITDEIAIDPDQSDDLLNLGNNKLTTSYTPGTSWGDNLISCIKIVYSPTKDPEAVGSLESYVDGLKTSWAALSSLLNINIIINMFEDLRNSTILLDAPPFSITYYIYKMGLASTLKSFAHIDIDELNLPGIRLSGLFITPISDLKTVFPLWYQTTEPVREDVNGDGKIDAPGEWVDLNQNGRWDQAGDIITQPEREPCPVNETGDYVTSLWSKDYDIGILGTFIDVDRDGLPDPGYEGFLFGAGNGKFDRGTELFEYDDNEVEVGKILGHVWPDNSRTDPSDGVVEENYYFFFPDPSFHGFLVPIEINTEKLTYRVTGKTMSNAELNALIVRMGNLLGVLTNNPIGGE